MAEHGQQEKGAGRSKANAFLSVNSRAAIGQEREYKQFTVSVNRVLYSGGNDISLADRVIAECPQTPG